MAIFLKPMVCRKSIRMCIPYRIIVSSVGSPLHKFASYLHNVFLHSIIPRVLSRVENSLDLVNRLNFKYLDDSFTLISLDVISLFTNVPINLALKNMSRRWRFIGICISFPKDEFLSAISFVFYLLLFCI